MLRRKLHRAIERELDAGETVAVISASVMPSQVHAPTSPGA